jgi:hypothetical protein
LFIRRNKFFLLKSSNNFNSEDYSDQIDKDDRLDMIYLRSFLNRVEKIFQEKDLASQKIK